jgi:hypothetical protein
LFTLEPETVSADPIVLNPQAENTSAQPIVGILVFNASNETFKVSFQGTTDWLHGYSIASLIASGSNVPNITLVPQDSTGSGIVYATVYQQGDSMPANVPTTITATTLTLASGSNVEISGPVSLAADSTVAISGAVDVSGSTVDASITNATLDISGTVDLATGTTVDANITNAAISVTGSTVTVEGAVTVSNDVTVTPSGTINVQGVANGTAIGVAGTVDISSGTIDIGNTPAVTIDSGTVDLASGATVEITGTPTVNLGSNNEVIVTEVQNVAGNVSIVNPINGTPLITRTQSIGSDSSVESSAISNTVTRLTNSTSNSITYSWAGNSFGAASQLEVFCCYGYVNTASSASYPVNVTLSLANVTGLSNVQIWGANPVSAEQAASGTDKFGYYDSVAFSWIVTGLSTSTAAATFDVTITLNNWVSGTGWGWNYWSQENHFAESSSTAFSNYTLTGIVSSSGSVNSTTISDTGVNFPGVSLIIGAPVFTVGANGDVLRPPTSLSVGSLLYSGGYFFADTDSQLTWHGWGFYIPQFPGDTLDVTCGSANYVATLVNSSCPLIGIPQ